MPGNRDEQRRQWWAAHPGLEKKPSMKRRKAGHDYYGRCIYMITLVIEGRRPVLGCLRDSDGAHPLPWVQPTPLGETVVQRWGAIIEHYPQVRPLNLQLMPDHLHGILFVTERMPQHLGRVVEAFKRAASTKAGLWEPGYNDTILQHEGQLDNMFNYLRQNPYRLWVKRNHPEYFTTRQGINIAGQEVTVMGNRFLLDHPCKMVVQCSRRMTQADIEREMERIMAEAGDGAVLVSPCISPGEKQIMRRAFDMGYPQIILLENGFSPNQKPAGRQFDACAQGRLLLVAPWPHHNECGAITREQCMRLNALAREISVGSIY